MKSEKSEKLVKADRESVGLQGQVGLEASEKKMLRFGFTE